MLVLISEPFDGVFQFIGQGTCLPPGGVDLLPHIGTCKGPDIAKTHVMVQLHSSPPYAKKPGASSRINVKYVPSVA